MNQYAPLLSTGEGASRYAVCNPAPSMEDVAAFELPLPIHNQSANESNGISDVQRRFLNESGSLLHVPCIPVTMPDGSTGYIINYDSDALLLQPSAPRPVDSLMLSSGSSYSSSSSSPPASEHEKQRDKKEKSKAPKRTYKKAILPKPQKQKLYERDESQIHDKAEKLRVLKAKRSKAYRIETK